MKFVCLLVMIVIATLLIFGIRIANQEKKLVTQSRRLTNLETDFSVHANHLRKLDDVLTNHDVVISHNKADFESIMNATVEAMGRMDALQKQLWTNQVELAWRLQQRGGAR